MIGFRVDANSEIATGHLMRCLAIAEAVRRLKGECVFFLADGICSDIVEERCFECVVLHSDWKNLESEIDILLKKISEYNLNWLVIDSYNITQQYMEQINKAVPVLGLDVSEEKKFEISAIVNYSHIDDAEKLKQKYRDFSTKIMTGLEYAPLRSEFEPEKRVFKREKQILVIAGGTDPYNISYKVTKRLLGVEKFGDYKILVVLGRLYKDKCLFEDVKNSRVSVRQNVSNMSELMQKSEIVVSAGGSSSIELCATQTPTVCFSFADNQIPFSKVLDENEILIYSGDIRDGESKFLDNVINDILRLIRDNNLKTSMSRKMGEICDGCGALRIAEFLLQ